jgi:hypothetical protein
MALSLDLCASVDHLASCHRPSFLADHEQVLFFQQDHGAWFCPPIDRAQKNYFLADHEQEYAHVGVTHHHDVASYMIGCLDYYIWDNYMTWLL